MAKQEDTVVHEYPSLGKYRVRVLALENGKHCLDIREHISDATFEGFTRRGIRLGIPEDAQALASTLNQLISTVTVRKGGKK